MIQPLHDTATKVSRWLAWIAGATILFGCALPVSIDVLTRAIIGHTVLESFEISSYAFAASIGLGMGYTVTSKANIRVDILTAKLPWRARIAVDMIAALTLASTALALAYYTFGVLSNSWQIGARSASTLRVPLMLPQLVWWAGFAWFAAIACLTPLFAAARLWAGDRSGAETLISNPDLMDELEEIGVDLTKDTQ